MPGPRAALAYCGPQLFCASASQHRAALIVALGAAEAAAAQPLEAGGDLVEIGPHLLDLVVDRTALRRLAVEQREKSGTVAAHALGLRGDAIEFALLLGRGVLVAADLLVPGRVAAAATAIDGRQLRFQPRAHRIDRRAPCGGGGAADSSAPRHQRSARRTPSSAAQARIHREKEGNQRFRHIRPLERSRAGSKPKARPTRLHIAASRGSVTSFPGRRCGRKTLDLAATDGSQRWQVMATYSLQPAWLQVIAGGLGNRPGDFIGIDAPVGRGLGEIPRLAIGPGGMRAAFLALGEALVDAIAVRLVGDDENAAVGRCRRRGEEERTGQKR